MVIVNSPQHLAVGEKPQNVADVINTNPKQSYASQLLQNQAAATISKLELFPVSIIHGEPTIEFTRDEINDFTREEGLHQAVVMKFSYGKPELQEIRRVFSIQFDVQGRCNIGQLDYRHILVRFDLYTDFVQFLSRSTGYIKDKDDEYFYRTFPWTFDFNPKEETTMAVVWISLPGLPTNLFAKKSLLSIASAAGKVLAVDKATQDRTRPSTGRVKVILDLLDNHPKKVKLRIVDKTTGKSLVLYQEIVYDNLPSYCCYCKHQGHDERTCRILKEKTGQNLVAAVDRNRQVDRNLPVVDSSTVEQLKGDAREFLNAKKKAHNKDQIAEKQANNIRHHVLQVGKSKVDVTGIELSPITAGRYANKSNAVVFENTLAQHGKVPDVHIEDNLKLTKGFHKSSSDIPISIVSARMHNAIADTLTSATNRAYDCGQHLNAANIVSQSNARTSKGLEQHVGKDNLDKFTCENEEKLATQEVNNLGKASSVSKIAGVRSVTSDIVEPTVQTSTLKDAGVRGSANKGAGQFPTGQENIIDQQPSATSFDLIEKPAAQFTTAVQIDQLLLDGNVVRDHLERNTSSTGHLSPRARQTQNEKKISKEIVQFSSSANKQEELLNNCTNVPTLHFSSPQVEKIINDAQDAMLVHTNMLKTPLVALNTSIFEIPSQSEGSCSVKGGEHGQLILSTGASEQQQNIAENDYITKINTWVDQLEKEKEEDWGDEDEDESTDFDSNESEDEDLRSVASTQLPSSNLNLNAPNAPPTVIASAGQKQPLVVAATTATGQQQMQKSTSRTLVIGQQLSATIPAVVDVSEQLRNISKTTAIDEKQNQQRQATPDKKKQNMLATGGVQRNDLCINNEVISNAGTQSKSGVQQQYTRKNSAQHRKKPQMTVTPPTNAGQQQQKYHQTRSQGQQQMQICTVASTSEPYSGRNNVYQDVEINYPLTLRDMERHDSKVNEPTQVVSTVFKRSTRSKR